MADAPLYTHTPLAYEDLSQIFTCDVCWITVHAMHLDRHTDWHRRVPG